MVFHGFLIIFTFFHGLFHVFTWFSMVSAWFGPGYGFSMVAVSFGSGAEASALATAQLMALRLTAEGKVGGLPFGSEFCLERLEKTMKSR